MARCVYVWLCVCVFVCCVCGASLAHVRTDTHPQRFGTFCVGALGNALLAADAAGRPMLPGG